MAVTLNEISQWLTNNEIGHKVLDEKSKIMFAIGNGETSKSIFIEVEEDGNLFQMYMNLLDEDLDMVKIADSEHVQKILAFILKLNYETKFGTWEYDPSDGEVRCAVEIPLEDALMTEKQFGRIFDYFAQNAQDGFDSILEIMKTGEMPEDDDAEQMLLELLQMMKDAKSSGSKSDEDGI